MVRSLAWHLGMWADRLRGKVSRVWLSDALWERLHYEAICSGAPADGIWRKQKHVYICGTRFEPRSNRVSRG